MKIWKVKGEGNPVLEVYEDYYGNLWFVTKIEDSEINFGYTRLYNMPQFAEWGSFPNLEGLKEELGKNKVWKVPKENWSNINSYEEGLLVEVNE